MKKILIVPLVLSVAMTMTACDVTYPKVKIPEQIKTVSTNTIQEIAGLDLTATFEMVDGDLLVRANLENNSSETIKLNYREGNLLEISIEDGNQVLMQRDIKGRERKVINPKETIRWEEKISFEGKTDQYKVKVSLLLINTSTIHYQPSELVKEKTMEIIGSGKGTKKEDEKGKDKKEDELHFLPNEPVTYTYTLNDGRKMREKYQYFEGNYVQSTNDLTGTKVYKWTDDGLYVVYETDEFKEENLIQDVQNRLEKSFTRKRVSDLTGTKGTRWVSRGADATIYSKGTTLKIGKNTYKDVIIVHSNSRAYYYKNEVGLLRVDEIADGENVILYELTKKKK